MSKDRRNINDIQFDKYTKHDGLYFCTECNRILFFIIHDNPHYFNDRKWRNKHHVFAVEDKCKINGNSKSKTITL